MSSNVVLLFDEQDSRRSLHAFGLRCAGFVVDEATDAQDAYRYITERCPHLVLIVTSRLGQRVCAFVGKLRADAYTRDLPVLGAVEQSDRVGAATAFQSGFSDYLTGPVAPEELVARVRACAQCTASFQAITTPTSGLSIDDEACAVRRGTRLAQLRPTEKRLLEFLFAHPNRVIPRDLLLFRVWGGGANQDSRVVDVTVCRLRRALEELGCDLILQTVNRHGYKLALASIDAREGIAAEAS